MLRELFLDALRDPDARQILADALEERGVHEYRVQAVRDAVGACNLFAAIGNLPDIEAGGELQDARATAEQIFRNAVSDLTALRHGHDHTPTWVEKLSVLYDVERVLADAEPPPDALRVCGWLWEIIGQAVREK